MIFFDFFVELAIKHYIRVEREAQSRIQAMEKFREDGYNHFSF